MGQIEGKFPAATRPLEYVALFCIKISTREGPGYVFMAYDQYSDFLFNLSVEKNEEPESVLKNIYFLMEDPHFAKYENEGFTLVLDKYDELSERINRILAPFKGKMLVDQTYNHYLSLPVIQSVAEYLKKKKL